MSDDLQASAAVGDATNPCSLVHQFFTTDTSFIQETPGDLFDAPDGAAIIHACNCKGAWGAGIAAIFRKNYPAAFEVYVQHCRAFKESPSSHNIYDLVYSRVSRFRSVNLPLGTALIIPPQERDIAIHSRRHWVVCLFASDGYGRHVDSSEKILSSLSAALKHLNEQLILLRMQAQRTGSEHPLSLYSNRFCTGLFHVRWELICDMINSIGLPINVCFPYTASTTGGRRGRLPVRLRSTEGNETGGQ